MKEICSASFAIHDTDLEANTFTGIASVFGSLIDAFIPTRIMPGAFTKTLTENAKRVRILYQHDERQPIGVPTSMKETEDGLVVAGKISQTTIGKDTIILMRDNVLTELSIGFDPIKFELVDEGPIGIVRHIKEVRLWEFSPVTFAADSKAKIHSVHSMKHLLANATESDVIRLLQGLVRLGLQPNVELTTVMSAAVRQSAERLKGKVLSKKNYALIKSAVDALNKLLEAAEPDEQSFPLTAVTTSTLAALEAQLASLK